MAHVYQLHSIPAFGPQLYQRPQRLRLLQPVRRFFATALDAKLTPIFRHDVSWGTKGSDKADVLPSVSSKKTEKDASEVFTSGDLMGRLGRKFEGVNLLEIEKYLRNSKVCNIVPKLRTTPTSIR